MSQSETRTEPTSHWRDLLKVHPAAEMFPMMSPDELKDLGEDIKANGLTMPIALFLDENYQLSVLDGRNRLDALVAIGFKFSSGENAEPPAVTHPDGRTLNKEAMWKVHREGSDLNPNAFVASANIHRRHLTPEQRKTIAAALLKANPERSNRSIPPHLIETTAWPFAASFKPSGMPERRLADKGKQR